MDLIQKVATIDGFMKDMLTLLRKVFFPI